MFDWRLSLDVFVLICLWFNGYSVGSVGGNPLNIIATLFCFASLVLIVLKAHIN